MIIRGTTPTKVYEIHGIDLTGYSYEISFKQGETIIFILQDEDCILQVVTEEETISKITVLLTQNQTLSLDAKKPVTIQVRYISMDGIAGATDIVTERVGNVQRDGVIVYDN